MKEKLDYFYGCQSEQFSFFRIPRILFDEKFKDMSTDAKVLYGLILDRMSISQKNGWTDEAKRVYIFFTNEEASEILKCSHSKVSKLFNELDGKRGYGLIERVMQGQGKPTIIYVKSFMSISKTVDDKKDKPKTSQNNKSAYKNDDNLNENNEISQEINEKTEKDVNFQKNENSDIKKFSVKTSQNDTSKHLLNTSQDFSKSDANYINKNYTEINYINQSKKISTIDRLIEDWDDEDLEDFTFSKVEETGTLPIEFIESEKVTCFSIKNLVDYENAKKYYNEIEFSILEIFVKALTQMLTSVEKMNLNNIAVSNIDVYNRLCQYIKCEKGIQSIYEIAHCVIISYKNACERKMITFPLAYMKSCIHTVLIDGIKGVNSIYAKI